MNITVRRYAAMGDTLSASVVGQALKLQGYSVTWQCLPQFHPVMRRCKWVDSVEDCTKAPQIALDFDYHKSDLRQTTHLYDLFFSAAKKQFPSIEWKPGLRPMLKHNPVGEQIIYETKLRDYASPWIMVCPRSEGYPMRQVPDYVWWNVSKEASFGTFFWLGIHPPPQGFVDLRQPNLEMLIDTIACADLFVTVDTGPMHIAAALDVPIVAIYQSVHPALRLPAGCGAQIVGRKDLGCLNCQKTLCPLDSTQPPCQKVSPQDIVEAVRIALTTCPGKALTKVPSKV